MAEARYRVGEMFAIPIAMDVWRKYDDMLTKFYLSDLSPTTEKDENKLKVSDVKSEFKFL